MTLLSSAKIIPTVGAAPKSSARAAARTWGIYLKMGRRRPAKDTALIPALLNLKSNNLIIMKAIWKNKVIAESDKTVVVENNHYFPPGSVKIEYLKKSGNTYKCHWKGIADYYDNNILINLRMLGYGCIIKLWQKV